MSVHPRLEEVTQRLIDRSQDSRSAYDRVMDGQPSAIGRGALSCTNMAHVSAAAGDVDKDILARQGERPNLGIVTAYNDMLSAHQPFGGFPFLIKEAARELRATAQVAGGVPAMCDGVTQGQPGMELSLFSRDVIAMATAVSLSHNAYDAALMLGVCDKIVPGLLLGALRFGFLPTIFVPAGPMPSGISNSEKAAIREKFAAGEIDEAELLEGELKSYHSPGTCTFYGTANSNQLLMEFMGLHVPGAAFEPPGTMLRNALTKFAAQQAVRLALEDGRPGALRHVFSAKTLINGVVGLLATGGSTNHLLHLVAVGAAGGWQLTLDDISDLSSAVPLLARVYPNGKADVNAFHAAGGCAFLIRELRDAGLLHDDVRTVMGDGLDPYTQIPELSADGDLSWQAVSDKSGDENIVRPVATPFAATGGLVTLKGNLGTAAVKVSAVEEKYHAIKAPCVVFDDADAFKKAFDAGELDRDHVSVVRFQGPRANGMPELHKLMPPLAVLQGRGFRVALVTDGRLSGASGKVLSAIHASPEALQQGPLCRLRSGDIVELDARTGSFQAHVDAAEFAAREPAQPTVDSESGLGRELFRSFRGLSSDALTGASLFDFS